MSRSLLGGREHQITHANVDIEVNSFCQRASRAKTRGWSGGSIIEPCESTVLAEKISSDREACL